LLRNKKLISFIGVGLILFIAIIFLWVNYVSKQPANAPLSSKEKKIAEIYSKLYEKNVDEVERLWRENGSWEKVNNLLEKEKFGILDHEKTTLVYEGYDIEDILKAEDLGLKNGSDAMEIIHTRGKGKDKVSWNTVIKKLKLEKQ